MMSNTENPTFRMKCSKCKKSTICEVLPVPPHVKKHSGKGNAPTQRGFRCTECRTGWHIQVGGSFSASSL